MSETLPCGGFLSAGSHKAYLADQRVAIALSDENAFWWTKDHKMQVIINRAIEAGKKVKNCGLYPFQEDDIKKLYRLKSASIESEMAAGKALPNSEPVLTANGFVPMNKLQVGDQVIGSDGKPTDIVGVYPQGTQEIFKVYFKDGTYARCTHDHLWAVNTPIRK